MKKAILLFVNFSVFSLGLSAQVAPISGSSIEFNGAEFISIPDNNSLDLQSSTTFEGWFKFCQEGTIFSKNYCQYQAGYYLSLLSDGTIAFTSHNGASCTSPIITETSTDVFSFNNWHHFAAIIEISGGNTIVNIYMDSLTNPSISISGNNFLSFNNSEPFRIASYRLLNGTIGTFPKGLMQEFRVYDSALPLSDLGLSTPSVTPFLRLGLQSGTSNVITNSGTNSGLVGALLNASASPINAQYVSSSTSLKCRLGLEENKQNSFNAISAYPNPANTILNIALHFGTINKGQTIRIMNINGSLLKEIQITGDKEVVSTDISGLQSGLYFISTIDSEGKYHSIKFIKN